MRRISITILVMFTLLLLSVKGISQKKEMTWTTKSKPAKELALDGAHHMMNAEFEQAYNDFSSAVKLDPDFTVALVFMNNLSRGESKKSYGERALKSASNKTEGEKLFATLADEKNTEENRRDIFAKLHSMFPDEKMLADFYVQTRATPEERFTAAGDFIKQFPDEPGMYNTIAYYYMNDKKDNEMAKKNFEKYISLYPDGTNPYDSMAEFYLNTGDTLNSKKYYNMALEKYPFNSSSVNALRKMPDPKKSTDK